MRRRLTSPLRLPVALAMAGTAAVLGPAPTADAQNRAWPSERPPALLAPRPVNFPDYELRTLANGLQVVAVSHHEQPSVSIRMLVRAGSAHDPPDKAGVAGLMGSLLDQGTTSRSAAQIADAIDFIGGSLGTGAGSDLTFVSALVMADSLRFGLEMVSEVARDPAFDPEELDRQRQQAYSSMRVSYEDPEYIANVVFDRLVYGFHPYGMPIGGTPESLARITREDVRAFHERYFAPNNALLAIVGDVTSEEAFAVAEQVFGTWARREVETPQFPEPPQPTRRVVVIDKPDAVQTEVRVGHLGIPRKHRDYMALNLAVKILGGEGSNRLHRVLRTERGLTYGAQAEMGTYKVSGDVVAETDTRSEATGEVLRLIVEEYFKLQRERPAPRELRDAQAYLTGTFPLTIETPDAIATQVLNNLFYELPLEELETHRERMNAVTVDEIARISQFYLKPDRLSVVLVGNVAAFRDQLRSAGFGQYEVVPLPDLDLFAVDFKKSGASGARVRP
jgi:zinc protease